MTITLRRALLWALDLLGAFVGVWAMVFPDAFYSSFPGGGFESWIAMDGAFNEHLIRDVGELYLALAAAGVVAALSRSVVASRAVAAAWLVSIALSAPLFIPDRRRADAALSTKEKTE